jgi:ubiquinone/menaquinone biosynthesis C-methylase UbiE
LNLLEMRGAWGGITSQAWDVLVAPVLVGVYQERWDASVTPDAIQPGMRVVDVGCGTGHLVGWLARRHPRTSFVGVDLSPVMLDRAWRKHGGLPNLRLERGDALALPLPDASVDLALSFASIKHWPDPARGIAELRRVTSPGGQVVVLEADHGASRSSARCFIDRWTWVPAPLRWLLTEYLLRVVIAQGIGQGDLERWFHQAGFDAVTVEVPADLPGVIARGRVPRGA